MVVGGGSENNRPRVPNTEATAWVLIFWSPDHPHQFSLCYALRSPPSLSSYTHTYTHTHTPLHVSGSLPLPLYLSPSLYFCLSFCLYQCLPLVLPVCHPFQMGSFPRLPPARPSPGRCLWAEGGCCLGGCVFQATAGGPSCSAQDLEATGRESVAPRGRQMHGWQREGVGTGLVVVGGIGRRRGRGATWQRIEAVWQNSQREGSERLGWGPPWAGA